MDLTQALAVMSTPVFIDGKSDNTLVAAVDDELRALTAAAATSGKVLPTKPLSPAAGAGTGVSARPIDAMLRLARATRPLISDDVYDWYRHWSWLRYLGVFDINGGRLELSGAGMRVRANQRRVLSEEMGVGIGVLVAETWCRHLGAAGSISVVDVDLALNEGRRWLQIHGGRLTVGRRQPDYLMIYPDPSGTRAFSFKTLECKGTTTMANVSGQLARASTQLACLQLDGVVPQGIAVDTISNASGVFYRAVDPEGSDGSDTVTITDRHLQQARQPAEIERASDGVLALPAGEFVASSLLLGMGTLADYAGNHSAALQFLPAETVRRLRREARDRVVRETGDGTFVGVEYLLPTPDGPSLRVFLGVAQEVDDALNTGQLDEVRAAQLVFHAERPSRSNPNGDFATTGDSRTVGATSDEGAVLILQR